MRPARKRELASVVCDEWGVSIRRACGVLEFDRSTYHYKSRRREQAGIEARIREICQTRVRYGYPLADRRLPSKRRNAARPRSFASRGVGDQHEEDPSDLQ